MCNTHVYKFILKPNNSHNALNAMAAMMKNAWCSIPNPIRLHTHSKVAVKAAKVASPPGTDRVASLAKPHPKVRMGVLAPRDNALLGCILRMRQSNNGVLQSVPS